MKQIMENVEFDVPQSKPTKEKSLTTLVTFLLDESGSMASCYGATLTGVNDFLNQQKKAKGKILFSLTKFNTDCKIVHVAESIKKIPNLDTVSYRPDGGTALLDAICCTIEAIDKSNQQADRYLFIIATDGQENASSQYTHKQVLELIAKKQNLGWSFVYLGANPDAFAVAHSMGIPKGNTALYDASRTGGALHAMTCATSNYLACNSRSVDNFYSTVHSADLKVASDEEVIGVSPVIVKKDNISIKKSFESLRDLEWKSIGVVTGTTTGGNISYSTSAGWQFDKDGKPKKVEQK